MIRFGTLGAANITPRALIYPCMDEPRAAVTTVAARDRSRAEGFAHYHQIPRVLDNYTEVIEHEKTDAIYIPLHIPAHHHWTLAALRAGKHVLCEKSLAANADQAREMAAVARESSRVLMDAFHYRYHPVFLRAREIFVSGLLGEIATVEAAFHIPVTDPDNIRMNYQTGGGVTMDIGCYPISWVRHIIGSEPMEVQAVAEEGPPDVDVMLKSEMLFPGGIRATTSGDMRPNAKFSAYISVSGSEGSLRVVNPIVPQNGHRIELTVNGRTTVETCDRRPTYGYQLDAFVEAVEQGAPLFTDGEDGSRQMQVIDRCYRAAGLRLRGQSSLLPGQSG
jgi:predicted dehydrogenase